jgi:hypothetical protein
MRQEPPLIPPGIKACPRLRHKRVSFLLRARIWQDHEECMRQIKGCLVLAPLREMAHQCAELVWKDRVIGRVKTTFDPKLITLIRHKFPVYKEEQANLSVSSCLQFEWHLEQVQGSLL